MSLLEQIRQGSYRGVPFDTVSISRERLKKNTEHRFSNSIRRFIEERGVQNEDFSLTFSIFAKGEDYVKRRNELRTALESEGVGVLVIPLEGEFKVKCTKCSDSQNIIENFGRCDFTAEFKVIGKNEESGNPVQAKNNKISMANKVESMKTLASDTVSNNVIVSHALSYTKSLDKLTGLADQMEGYANLATSGSLSSTALVLFRSNLPSFMTTPANIGIAITGLFTALESSFDSASALYEMSQSFFNFGDNDTKIVANTPERTEQVNNQQLLNTTIQVTATSVACNAISQIDFSNDENLKYVEEQINAQFEKLFEADGVNNNSLIGMADISYLLKQMHTDLNDIFDEKLAVTPKIQTISVNKTSLKMLAYQYYGSLDKYDDLVQLNNISNPKSLSGDVRIFTDA